MPRTCENNDLWRDRWGCTLGCYFPQWCHQVQGSDRPLRDGPQQLLSFHPDEDIEGRRLDDFCFYWISQIKMRKCLSFYSRCSSAVQRPWTNNPQDISSYWWIVPGLWEHQEILRDDGWLDRCRLGGFAADLGLHRFGHSLSNRALRILGCIYHFFLFCFNGFKIFYSLWSF